MKLNMIKNPIQEVTNKLQYRAIGIVNGIYNPHDEVVSFVNYLEEIYTSIDICNPVTLKKT